MSVYVTEPSEPAKACVIWMHGLGADAKDMANLAGQLPLKVPIRHVFIDAPIRPVTLNNGMSMRAWYDITGMELTHREDSEGVSKSEEIIRQVITSQISYGFKSKQIFLAGFSQGGAMALYAGLRMSPPLGGIIVLSGYLPLAKQCQAVLDKDTPIFIAAGTKDPIVLPLWTNQTIAILKTQGFKQVSSYEYPMEHSICAEEIQDMAKWLTSHVLSIKEGKDKS